MVIRYYAAALNILFALSCQINYRGMNELPQGQRERVGQRAEERRLQTNQETQSLRFCTSTKRRQQAAAAARQRQRQRQSNRKTSGSSSNNVGRDGNNQRPFAPAEVRALTESSSADGGSSSRRNTSERTWETYERERERERHKKTALTGSGIFKLDLPKTAASSRSAIHANTHTHTPHACMHV